MQIATKYPTYLQTFIVSIPQDINVYIYRRENFECHMFNPYPTAFPYGNGMILHFYQQQESSTTKTVHKVINKGLKAYIYSRFTLVRISINV